MRHTKFWSLFCVIAGLNGSPAALYAQTAPPAHLTRAQAIAIASGFCKAVGAPETGTPTAVYPAPPQFRGEQATFYAQCWQITFPDETEVDVVDSLRIVSSYENPTLINRLEQSRKPAGTSLSRAKALQYATVDLRAAGRITGLALSPTAHQMVLADPPMRGDVTWNVSWRRQYQDILYKEEWVSMSLDAETGTLETFSVKFPSPPVTTGRISVTKAQAEQKALVQLKAAKVPTPRFQSITEAVVQPNAFWKTFRGIDPVPNAPGRVVWDCFFTDSRHLTDELWVDTETGAIDGGQWFGRR